MPERAHKSPHTHESRQVQTPHVTVQKVPPDPTKKSRGCFFGCSNSSESERYEIEVTLGAVSWSIVKRLSEFELWHNKLHATLTAQTGLSQNDPRASRLAPLTEQEGARILNQMPNLPAKTSFWRKQSESEGTAAAQALQLYISNIIGINLRDQGKDMFRAELYDFLQITQNLTRHSKQSKLQPKVEAAQLTIEKEVYKERLEGMEAEVAEGAALQHQQAETLYHQVLCLQNEVNEASCRINLAIAENRKQEGAAPFGNATASPAARTPRSKLSAGNEIEDAKLSAAWPAMFNSEGLTTLHWLLCSYREPGSGELVPGRLYVVGRKGGAPGSRVLCFLGDQGSKLQFRVEHLSQLEKDSYMGGVHLGLVFHTREQQSEKAGAVGRAEDQKMFVMAVHDSMILNEKDADARRLAAEPDEPQDLDEGLDSSEHCFRLSSHSGSKQQYGCSKAGCQVHAFYKICDRKKELHRLAEFCELRAGDDGVFRGCDDEYDLEDDEEASEPIDI